MTNTAQEAPHSEFNMQIIISNVLEELSELYSDDQSFIPQSILWEKINELEEIQSLEGDSKANIYRLFLSSLVGQKNSLSLFESYENPDNPLDIRWRIRPSSSHINLIPTQKEEQSSTPSEEQRIAELQKTLTSLRRQSAKLESENRQYMIVIEQLKLAATTEVQNHFTLFDSFHNYIEQSGHNLNFIEKSLSDINQKIEDLDQL